MAEQLPPAAIAVHGHNWGQLCLNPTVLVNLFGYTMGEITEAGTRTGRRNILN